MLTPTQVSLDADLVESLQQIAAEQGLTLDQVISDLARQYLRQARRAKLQREAEAYQALYVDLKSKYLGQHVAIHDGNLVDHDADPVVLVRRVRQRFGHAPILIRQVEEQPDREFVLRSPRLETST